MNHTQLLPLLFGLVLWLASALTARADTPTALTITGAQNLELTTSDANACYIDGDTNALHAQLTDPRGAVVVSLTVLGTVGPHPALGTTGPQLTLLTLDAAAADPLVNWAATGGTVTVDDLATTVPIESGDQTVRASTRGILGHIDADLTSSNGTIHITGPFACHTAG